MTREYVCDICGEVIEGKFYTVDIDKKHFTGKGYTAESIYRSRLDVESPYHFHKDCAKNFFENLEGMVFEDD